MIRKDVRIVRKGSQDEKRITFEGSRGPFELMQSIVLQATTVKDGIERDPHLRAEAERKAHNTRAKGKVVTIKLILHTSLWDLSQTL